MAKLVALLAPALSGVAALFPEGSAEAKQLADSMAELEKATATTPSVRDSRVALERAVREQGKAASERERLLEKQTELRKSIQVVDEELAANEARRAKAAQAVAEEAKAEAERYKARFDKAFEAHAEVGAISGQMANIDESGATSMMFHAVRRRASLPAHAPPRCLTPHHRLLCWRTCSCLDYP